MPPSSNLPGSGDLSWISFLPEGADVICVGEPDPRVSVALQRHARTVDFMADRSDLSADVVVCCADPEPIALLAELAPHSLVVAPRGVADIGADRSWVILPGGDRPSRWRRRWTRLWSMALGRAASAAGRRPPTSARRHASDVKFVSVPRDLASRPDGSRPSVGLPSPSLPDHLLDMARSAGIDLRGRRWDFGAPRGFESQKVVFRIPATRDEGGVIVKLTQHARFNERLEAEGDALRSPAFASGLEFLEVPRALFEGRHLGLAVLGQSIIDGRSFRMVAGLEPGDPVAEAGFRAAMELSARTRSDVEPLEVRTGLTTLLDDFDRIYSIPGRLRASLDESVQRVVDARVPTVFMHGDLGIWNLIVQPNARIGAIDWENVDPSGMPLWDLFVYARTLGVLHADLRGIRYSPRVFARQFLAESGFRTQIFGWIREYCGEVGVAYEAVDAAFTLCWVQQAVREAASLARPDWDSSRNIRFVEAAISSPLGFRG